MKLTKATLGQLALQNGQNEQIVLDDDVPGFGVRLRAGGSCNWIFQYRIGRKQRRLGLGSATALSVTEARAQAARLYAKVKLGEDPAARKAEAVARAAETFEALLAPFLVRQAERLKPRSFDEVARHLRVLVKPLHRLQLAAIDRRTVAKSWGRSAKVAGLPPPTGRAPTCRPSLRGR